MGARVVNNTGKLTTTYGQRCVVSSGVHAWCFNPQVVVTQYSEWQGFKPIYNQVLIQYCVYEYSSHRDISKHRPALISGSHFRENKLRRRQRTSQVGCILIDART